MKGKGDVKTHVLAQNKRRSNMRNHSRKPTFAPQSLTRNIGKFKQKEHHGALSEDSSNEKDDNKISQLIDMSLDYHNHQNQFSMDESVIDQCKL